MVHISPQEVQPQQKNLIQERSLEVLVILWYECDITVLTQVRDEFKHIRVLISMSISGEN